MTVQEALEAIGGTGDSDFSVIVLRKEKGELLAAGALGVAIDESTNDVSVVIGEFHGEDVSLEDEVLEDAVPAADIHEAFGTIRERCGDWPLFSAGVEDPTLGGSIVGHSVDAELEVFAFLQGPKSDWVD